MFFKNLNSVENSKLLFSLSNFACSNLNFILCRGGMVQTAEQYEFVHQALSIFESTLPEASGDWRASKSSKFDLYLHVGDVVDVLLMCISMFIGEWLYVYIWCLEQFLCHVMGVICIWIRFVSESLTHMVLLSWMLLIMPFLYIIIREGKRPATHEITLNFLPFFFYSTWFC